MKTEYGFGTTLQVPYEEAIPRVKEALKAEGFGVLTEIDVRRTLHEKLGAEMEPYIILGAQPPVGASRTGAGTRDRVTFAMQRRGAYSRHGQSRRSR